MRKLCARGNTLIRKFKFCDISVKCNLFKTFCYSFYCASLWSNYKKATLARLRVNYNNVMRKLVGVPMYSSASHLFGSLGVNSLLELMRKITYSLLERVQNSSNVLIVLIYNSEATLRSAIWKHWNTLLFV